MHQTKDGLCGLAEQRNGWRHGREISVKCSRVTKMQQYNWSTHQTLIFIKEQVVVTQSAENVLAWKYFLVT